MQNRKVAIMFSDDILMKMRMKKAYSYAMTHILNKNLLPEINSIEANMASMPAVTMITRFVVLKKDINESYILSLFLGSKSDSCKSLTWYK